MEKVADNITLSLKKMTGLMIQEVLSFFPHRWVFILGPARQYQLLLDFDNAHPTFALKEEKFQSPWLAAVHTITELLKSATILSLSIHDDQYLILTCQKPHHPTIITINIQLVPYGPRFTIFMHELVRFDSILGWQPATAIPLKRGKLTESNTLDLATFYAEDLTHQYSVILEAAIKKKRQRANALTSDLEKHQRHLNYQAIADAIKVAPGLTIDQYANPELLPIPDQFQTGNFSLMNLCYARYKKAKSGCEEVKRQQLENQEVLETLMAIQQALRNPLVNLKEIGDQLASMHLISGTKVKPEVVKSESPYWLEVNGSKLSFGKNAKQNDYLTFQIAKKQEIFLHIQGKPGSHVILHHRTFDHDKVVLAAQLVLALAGLHTGDVTYAKVGSLKATTILGQVMVKDFKTIRVNGQHEKMLALIKQAKRY